MSTAAPRSNLLFYAGVGLALSVAILRIIAIFAPALVIWTIMRSPGEGLGSFPRAFHLWIDDLTQIAGVGRTGIIAQLAITAIVFGTLAILATLTALRKVIARRLLVAACSVLLVYYTSASIVLAVKSGGHALPGQIDWIVLYAVILVIFTRKSVVQLFHQET